MGEGGKDNLAVRWRATLQARLAAAHAADEREFDQARVRVALLVMLVIYFLGVAWGDGELDDAETLLVVTGFFHAIASLGHLAWILGVSRVSPPRRVAGICIDQTSTTAVMWIFGEPAAFMFGVYLWVVIGNGFRFGRRYLFCAQAITLAGMGLLLTSEFWRAHLSFWAAGVFLVVAIPAYAAVLIARLDQARREAEDANRSKSRFLAAASHDLRQPMQALSMYAQVLQDRLREPAAQRALHGIELSVQTLEQLFDSLLDLSRFEAGVVKAGIVAFPLQPLIERVVDAQRPFAARKGLDLRIVPTARIARSDPLLLERMLGNLVTNAVRYTDRGGIVVGCRRRGAGRVALQVVDTGPGIAPQDQARIFDEYTQLPAGNAAASAQGLGLGLPIVKSLAALLGHSIGVVATLGRGSTFFIEAPEAAAPDAMAAPANAPLLPPLRGICVVVDDDAEIRESLRMLLESWGVRYFGGATLDEVRRQLADAAARPDALVVDYRLAESRTGVEVVRELRAQFGDALPALIITGTPTDALREEAGAGTSVAVKPVPPGKLRAFLSQARLPSAAPQAA